MFLRFVIITNYHRNSQLLSKTQYKTLLDQSVELAQLRIKVTKMENLIKKKSIDIKKLHRRNRYLENMLEKERSEEENTEDPGTQENTENQPNSSVRNF